MESFRLSALYFLGKHICVTKGRVICTSRSQIQAGDKVAFLFGGKMCYLLRPVDGGQYYELISDAYVNGYMNGETLGGLAGSTSLVPVKE